MRRALALLFLAVCAVPAQDLPPEVLRLARIRTRVREVLDRLPDCACIETVTRYVKPGGGDLRLLDTVVFQILFSEGNELFASPGDTHWEANPFAFLSSGMMANGFFALHLRSIFLNNQSIIRYHGMESPTGRLEARYDFNISRMLSGYTVHHAGATGVVASRGSFWADPETYDLRRLEFHAEEIPRELRYADISTAIYYDRVSIGESEVLLPQAADLRTTGVRGDENRDLIEFTHCQGFHTESTLRFGDAGSTPAPGPAAAPPKPVVEGALPANLRIAIALSGSLDDDASVGSLIQGRVVSSVVNKGKVLVPEGALVKGRIRRLDRYTDAGGYFIVALEFMAIEMPAANLRFYADLRDVDVSEGVEMRNPGGLAWDNMPGGRVWTHEAPGVGTFFVRGSHFLLPPGFRTFWKTRPYPQSATR